jgi:hypothetical protein
MEFSVSGKNHGLIQWVQILICQLLRNNWLILHSRNYLETITVSLSTHKYNTFTYFYLFLLVPNVSPEPNSTSPVTHRTNSSFVVHWKPPQNCTFLNGYLYRYRFELTSRNNSKWLREGTTRLTSANFTDLTPHTMYVVRVYLVTSGGRNTNYPLKIPAYTKGTS